MKRFLISLFFLTALPSALASEVDNFTHRYRPLSDSTRAINKKSNRLIRQALSFSNANPYKKFGCDKDVLYQEMRYSFRFFLWGEFVEWILDAPEVERLETPLEEGIYRDFTRFYFMSLASDFYNGPLADSINVNGHLVGLDKFEHFLGSGFEYFKTRYLQNQSIEETLEIGFCSEVGLMGIVLTGVKSFADLSANFNGMRFWNHLLQQEDDILGKSHNKGPYVACENNRWVQIKEMDWSDYIDASFDEAVNCNDFATPNKLEYVLANIAELEQKTRQSYTCPVKPAELPHLKRKYGKFFPSIINFEGHRVFELEVEREGACFWAAVLNDPIESGKDFQVPYYSPF